MWTEYLIDLDGIGAGNTGRLAFRYFVTDAGPSGANSNYIGIDAIRVYEPDVQDCNLNGVLDECDVLGDLNGDDQLSAADFDGFAERLSGPDIPAMPACSLADFDDADGDVDLWDFAGFQAAVSSQ